MKKIATITFWIIFTIVFVAIAFFITKTVYINVSEKMFGSTTGLSDGSLQKMNEENQPSQTFECLSDNGVTSRTYIYVRGFGNESTVIDELKPLMKADKKFVGLLDYSYDVKRTLDDVVDDFTRQVNVFLKSHESDEVVIIAQSAGGVIAAQYDYSLYNDRTIELHTMASPLNGYHAPSIFLPDDMIGISRDIALGIGKYKKVGNHVHAIHHKTVTDTTLVEMCGGFASFCNAKTVQNNNLNNSIEVWYPKHTHDSIMAHVGKKVVACQK